jgi:hypothetical protein
MKRRPTPFAAILARLGLWLSAFALLSQSLAIAAPPMVSGDARSAAAELTALLGPGVVVCTQADSGDVPHPSPADCRDQCPLCQVVASAAALDLPVVAGEPAPTRTLAEKIRFTPQTLEIAKPRSKFSRARGPPSLT